MRKYYIVKSQPDLTGNIIPIKILNYPEIIYGPPIIKLTPGINPYSIINLKILGPLFEYNLILPYKLLRPVINDLYLNSLYPQTATAQRITFRIIAPGFDVNLVSSYAGIYNSISNIQNKYGNYINYSNIGSPTIYNLNNLLAKLKTSFPENQYEPL